MRAGRNVVIDLAGVGSLDSPGLNILIRCYKPLDEQGRRLVLRSPQKAVRRRLEARRHHHPLVDVETLVLAAWRWCGP